MSKRLGWRGRGGEVKKRGTKTMEGGCAMGTGDTRGFTLYEAFGACEIGPWWAGMADL